MSTSNSEMKRRTIQAGEYRMVWDYWAAHAEHFPEREAIVHWDVLGRPFRWTYGRLYRAALQVSRRLADRGVKKGDVCALLIRHHRQFYPAYMGIAALGAIPAVLAYPNPRLHPDKFKQGLTGMAKHSGLDWMVTERALVSQLRPLLKMNPGTLRGIIPWTSLWRKGTGHRVPIQDPARWRGEVGESDPFLLQHKV